jgi:AcrR family transcriptional regulator
MARIVKEEEYAGKRNAILDVAQQLVYTKGYEQMSIQDILDDLQISKGAFYHYFDSKQALLEAIIEHMGEEVERLLILIVKDAHLAALEKLQRFFDTMNRWKTSRKDFFLELLRVWYTDDNAIVRQKVHAIAFKKNAPLIREIIRQGIQEGIFTTSYPERVGEVILSLVLDLSNTIGELILSFQSERDGMLRIESTIAAYTDAFERILGVPAGSLSLIDDQTLKEWFISPLDYEVEMKS